MRRTDEKPGTPYNCEDGDTFSASSSNHSMAWRQVCTLVPVHGQGRGAEQVRRDMAWVFVRYAPADSPLYAIESEVRAVRRGFMGYAAPRAAVGVASS